MIRYPRQYATIARLLSNDLPTPRVNTWQNLLYSCGIISLTAARPGPRPIRRPNHDRNRLIKSTNSTRSSARKCDDRFPTTATGSSATTLVH